MLNALIAVVGPCLHLDLQNTRITADDLLVVLGYASANRISWRQPAQNREVPRLLTVCGSVGTSLTRAGNLAAGTQPHSASQNAVEGEERQTILLRGYRSNLDPYHGGCYEEEEIVRGEAKSGTTHFHGSRILSVEGVR